MIVLYGSTYVWRATLKDENGDAVLGADVLLTLLERSTLSQVSGESWPVLMTPSSTVPGLYEYETVDAVVDELAEGRLYLAVAEAELSGRRRYVRRPFTVRADNV